MKAKRAQNLIAVAVFSAVAFVATIARASEPINEQDAYEIGVEAYIYLYPLVLMDTTRRQAVNVEAGQVIGRGPMNVFTHVPIFPPADFRDVVRPNFDTLYSITWLDLTKEPMVVATADTQGRYYLLPMLDMWTDVFASPGKRTTGTGAGSFAVVPPGWHGDLPQSVERIDAPTPYVWIIGRTQTNGSKDYEAVHKVQEGYTITPLSQWGKTPPTVKPVIDSAVDMKTAPMIQVDGTGRKASPCACGPSAGPDQSGICSIEHVIFSVCQSESVVIS
jgi:hypothetical protein